MAWLYLCIASVFEVCWTISLKLLDVKQMKQAHWMNLGQWKQNGLLLLPLVGYILFGIGNIYCFSMAMKTIPVSTAMAIWFGLALIGVKMVDTFYFKVPFAYNQLFFLLLIVICVVGLKRSI